VHRGRATIHSTAPPAVERATIHPRTHSALHIEEDRESSTIHSPAPPSALWEDQPFIQEHSTLIQHSILKRKRMEEEQDLLAMEAHVGVTCDGCSSVNFAGIRHKCQECFDYDLCHECVLTGVTSKQHQTTHSMQSIMPPRSADLDMFLADDYELDPWDDINASRTSIKRLSRRIPQLIIEEGVRFQNLFYKCPYCEETGLNEQQLCIHVEDFHPTDTKPVVCPVCATAPGGDPLYISRNFQDHLEARHFNKDRHKRGTSKPTFTFISPESGTSKANADSIRNLFTHLAKKKSKEAQHASTTTKSTTTMTTTTSPKVQKKPLLPSFRAPPIRTPEEQTVFEQKQALKSIFLQELLYSTILENNDENIDDNDNNNNNNNNNNTKANK